MEKANEWVTSILSDDEKLQQLNTTVTVVTAAIAAGTSGFIAYRTAMAISGVISAVRNATEGMTIAQAALNAVMSANPVAIVVTALAALRAVWQRPMPQTRTSGRAGTARGVPSRTGFPRWQTISSTS